MNDQFKSWAIVEVMGHNEYAGCVTAETIAGSPMLRIDVPETSARPAFTKYLSMASIYGISPCSEETARDRAESKKATPFACWDVESQVVAKLKEKGLLLENSQLEAKPARVRIETWDDPRDDDDGDCE